MIIALSIVPYMQVRLKTIVLSAMIVPIQNALIRSEIPKDVDILNGRDTKVVGIENLNYLVSIKLKFIPPASQL